MKSFCKHLLVSAIALGLSASALAADAITCDPMGPMMQGRGMSDMTPAQRTEYMKVRMDQRHAYLHDKLNLTAKQEPAWKEFIAGAQPSMMGPQMQRDEMMKLTTPQRMEKMLEYAKARQAHMATRLEALKKFYAVLTPEQQKMFDAEYMDPRGPRGPRGPGGPGRRGGMHGMGPCAAPASVTQ